ncbi:hypothetical protein FIBSPDRAFT_908422 [Athelia psychrophila]|uniref:DNA breaking-rejoining enzyme n=1 Tax=Athelia psychrophila TaxID=1759441 RepID=A0A166S784_9AGAM|nr:hypothetical protein FIBSPDRAFT_908422 [Fibularhizoctonia sp. CBS 109695]
MRAAISHKFGREYGRGTQPWVENPLKPGEYTGNPSLAIPVCQYMISLRRRKVRAGEVVTSARAIDEPTMKRLYLFNSTFDPHEEHTSQSRKRKQEDPHCWAGYGLRLMLMLLYCISMLCLLRYDEALKITWADVSFEYDTTNTPILRLDLPFRKTHQNGGIQPFYLYPDPKRPWLCPVSLFAEWWLVSGGQQGGYVFRRKSGNRFSADGFERMTNESFLECFRRNLCDIGIDPRPYGTHSFRRGGCQFLAMVLRWPYRTICDWGGWAENFDNPGTIFKYLLSWTDSPGAARRDYFNPNRPLADPCNSCGRTCHCA